MQPVRRPGWGHHIGHRMEPAGGGSEGGGGGEMEGPGILYHPLVCLGRAAKPKGLARMSLPVFKLNSAHPSTGHEAGRVGAMYGSASDGGDNGV